MEPHPDFADRPPPRRATLAGLALAPLGLDDLDEDFAAVTRSAALLRGLFGGDWPDGLTREADAADLAWHAREFDLRRSFAWAIRGADGAYLGCAYLFPDPGARGRGRAAFWFAADAAAPWRVAAFRAAFAEALAAWGAPADAYPLRDPHGGG